MPKKDTDSQLLGRIDERTRGINDRLDKLEIKIDKNFVTRAEFTPVRNIAYGLVSVTVLTVLGAILALVLKQ